MHKYGENESVPQTQPVEIGSEKYMFRKVLDITYFNDDHINLNKKPMNDLEDQFSKEYFI